MDATLKRFEPIIRSTVTEPEKLIKCAKPSGYWLIASQGIEDNPKQSTRDNREYQIELDLLGKTFFQSTRYTVL